MVPAPPEKPGAAADRKCPLFVPKTATGGGSQGAPARPPKADAAPPKPPAAGTQNQTPPHLPAAFAQGVARLPNKSPDMSVPSRLPPKPPPAPALPAPTGERKVTIKKALADRVRQLNASGQLNGEIKLAKVAKAFAPLDTQSALGVLDSLLDSAPDCKDPTAWVCDVAASVAEDRGLEPGVPPAEDEPPAKVRRVGGPSAGSKRGDPLPPPRRPPNGPNQSDGPPPEDSDGQEFGDQHMEAPEDGGEGDEQQKVAAALDAEEPEDAPSGGSNSRKTELFHHFERGFRAQGNASRFSHAMLPKPPPMAVTPPHGGREWPPEFRGVHSEYHIPSKYKTMLCRHFERGSCQHGLDCQFAHGVDELRRPGVHGEPSRPVQPPPVINALLGPEICRDFARGRCNFGNDCRFVHTDPRITGPGPDENSRFPHSLDDEPGEEQPRDDEARELPQPPARLPHEICRDFLRGRCKFGSSCRFSHTNPLDASSPYDPSDPADLSGTADSTQEQDFDPEPEPAWEAPSRGGGGSKRPRYDQGRGGAPQAEICVDFQRGVCKFGSSCRYIHGTQDLGMQITRVPWTSGGGGAVGPALVVGPGRNGEDSAPHDWGGRGAPPPPPNVVPIKYKVERCRHFDRGHCQLGDLCGYAHGEEEIRKAMG